MNFVTTVLRISPAFLSANENTQLVLPVPNSYTYFYLIRLKQLSRIFFQPRIFVESY